MKFSREMGCGNKNHILSGLEELFAPLIDGDHVHCARWSRESDAGAYTYTDEAGRAKLGFALPPIQLNIDRPRVWVRNVKKSRLGIDAAWARFDSARRAWWTSLLRTNLVPVLGYEESVAEGMRCAGMYWGGLIETCGWTTIGLLCPRHQPRRWWSPSHTGEMSGPPPREVVEAYDAYVAAVALPNWDVIYHVTREISSIEEVRDAIKVGRIGDRIWATYEVVYQVGWKTFNGPPPGYDPEAK